MKGITFKEGKGNVDTFLDEDNGLMYFRVNLNNEELPTSNSSGNTMMAKGFVNFTHNDQRIFGNLNLNIGKNKAVIKQELVDAMEIYRGHSFAKAALESVLWDILGKLAEKSVADMLCEPDGRARPWVKTNIAVGIKDSPEELVKSVPAR